MNVDFGGAETVLYVPGPDGYLNFVNPSEAWTNDPNCAEPFQGNPYIGFRVCAPEDTYLYVGTTNEALDGFDTVLSVELIPEGTCLTYNDDTFSGQSQVELVPRIPGSSECFIVHLAARDSTAENILSGITFDIIRDA